MVNRGPLKITIIMIAAVISGCMGIGQGDFSCPGGILGVRCFSARQIYQATESSDYVEPSNAEENKTPNNREFVSGGERSHTNQAVVPRINQPMPIRTQAEVMRIWVASWEDEDGDLHADGYLYTEIENRHWNLGERFKSPGATLSPLSSNAARPGTE